MSEKVLATYTLTLHGPPYTKEVLRSGSLGISPELLRETEENLNDLLGPLYHVEIREWNSPGEGYEVAGLHWMREGKLIDATE